MGTPTWAEDIGAREEQQDAGAIIARDGVVFAVVADGIGGHVGGAEAAALTVRAMMQIFTASFAFPNRSDVHWSYVLFTGVQQASREVAALAEAHGYRAGSRNAPGCTLTAAIVVPAPRRSDGATAYILHVGDSWAMVDGRVATAQHGYRNVLLSSIPQTTMVDLLVRQFEDSVILSSDGINDALVRPYCDAAQLVTLQKAEKHPKQDNMLVVKLPAVWDPGQVFAEWLGAASKWTLADFVKPLN